MPYESHVTTSAVFQSPARIEYPFAEEGDTTTKIVYQPLLQLADRYTAPTIGGTFSNSLANFSGSPISIGTAYCIGDSIPQSADAGLVSFTRAWANVPATRYEYELTPVTFPAVQNERDSFSKAVIVKTTIEYHRVDTGATYTTVDSLPVVAVSMLTNYASLNVPILSPAYVSVSTTPTKTDYLASIGVSYSLVMDSKIERWKGNIWKVITRRVKPL